MVGVMDISLSISCLHSGSIFPCLFCRVDPRYVQRTFIVDELGCLNCVRAWFVKITGLLRVPRVGDVCYSSIVRYCAPRLHSRQGTQTELANPKPMCVSTFYS